MKHTIKLTMILFLSILGFVSCEKKEGTAPQPELVVKDYYPNSGRAGTLVTIAGSGFSTSIADYKATIAGKDVEVISATADYLVLRMPDGGASGKLEVKCQDKVLSIGTYTYQDLTVSTIFPTNGMAGTQIRIEGEGFGSTAGLAEVSINGKKALVVSVSDKVIVAEVPDEAGFGPVSVKVEGKESKGQNFKYQAVYGIKPLSGGKGTRVVISGVGFEEQAIGNIVDFNGERAVVVESTDKQLVVLAPDKVSSGPLSVNINNQKITGPAFTVVGKPIIGTVSPLSGPKDVEMTISGELFSADLSENKVYINNVLIPVISANAEELKLKIPGGTGSGTVRVVVNDQVTEGPQFKDQNLGIIGMTPDNGMTGTQVTISGTGFSTNVTENQVYFNGVLTPVKTATENKLVLDAPAGLSTGAVRVKVDGQEAVAPTNFRRAGVVTLAGGPNTSLFASYMTAIAIDQQGNLYVTDTNNKMVKKITPAGAVSVLQANGADATFNTPFGIVIDKQNNIYISDMGNENIVKITSSGQRSIHASGFKPGHMSVDEAGNLYVSNNNSFSAGLVKVIPTGVFSRFAQAFSVTARTVIDTDGSFYYSDQSSSSGNSIHLMTPNGTRVTDWVGSSDGGYQDGTSALFNNIGTMVRFENKIRVGERYSFNIREVDIASKRTTTLYKTNGNGFVDGSLLVAKFGNITDMAVDKDGTIYVLDAPNKAIRKVYLK